MALVLSKNQALTDIVSSGNPITTSHPTTGSAVATRVWLFNNDATKRYEEVQVSAQDTNGTNEAGWMAFAPDNNGTAGTYTSALTLANISSANTGQAFWVRTTTPSVTDSQNKTDLQIKATAKEYAV